jgi:sugar phosphate isomerase/epimerase
MPQVSITTLNSMADRNFTAALNRHVQWGLRHLDLKDAIFGKDVIDLTESEAGRAADMISARDLSVYCLSTSLFHDKVESGIEAFRKNHLEPLGHIIELAQIFRPSLIRLLSARSLRRDEIQNSVDYLRTDHPWLIDLYRVAVEKVAAAGFECTIENESHANLFSDPWEILEFFDLLDCGNAVNLTWDVQNLWQMGTYPSLNVYQQLKPLMAYYHLKGSMSEPGTNILRWKSCLEDASWPVLEITGQVILDGVSPVICLNPSHGVEKEGYDYRNTVGHDIAYVRNAFGGTVS